MQKCFTKVKKLLNESRKFTQKYNVVFLQDANYFFKIHIDLIIMYKHINIYNT